MADTQTQANTYVLFTLAGTTYAVHSDLIQQMDMVAELTITPVPNAPAFVEGVVFSRGQVIPALNLRVRFGFNKIPYDLKTRLLVINSGGRVLGLIVDSAREFVRLPAEAIRPPNEAIAGLSGHYLEGIVLLGDRIVLVLRLAEVLNATVEAQFVLNEPGPASSGQLEPGAAPA